ncbi:MAG: 50S ribosomal protein L9 [Candidatus Jacksonbacteria bacterium]|nr:50S ribosomal protein L9 [Candidatus Jacksonbacteria bacterium]
MTIKVILTQNVPGLGEKGDIVDVSRGHARNFLIAKGHARKASDKDEKNASEIMKAAESRHEAELTRLKDLKERLSKKHIMLAIPGNSQGTLYRSASEEDVAEALFTTYGVNIPASCVKMETIKTAGHHSFKLAMKDHGEIVMRARVRALQ